MSNADAPAAPLDRAVEEARKTLADARKIIDKWIIGYKAPPKSELAGHILILSESLVSLLATIDADPWQTARMEAEAALRDIEDAIRVPGDPAPILVAVRGMVAGYFARREGEKGENRG